MTKSNLENCNRERHKRNNGLKYFKISHFSQKNDGLHKSNALKRSSGAAAGLLEGGQGAANKKEIKKGAANKKESKKG